MMFGFHKRSKADASLAVFDDTVTIAANKWRYFCDTLPFRPDVPLADRIAAFMVPFGEGVRKNVPALAEAPDGVLLLIVAKGIERSGTHSKADIERGLGLAIPD